MPMKRIPRLSELPDVMPAPDFWEIFGRSEHERLDFKHKHAKSVFESVAAMAMTDGGIIAVGISDDRSFVGAALGQKARDSALDAGHKCGVEVQAREITIDGKAVMLVAVPEVRGRIVTTPDGRLLRRVGSSSQPLTGDALARFVRERADVSAEEETALDLEPRDLRLDLVNKVLEADGKRRVKGQNIVSGLIDLEVAKAAEPPLDPVVLRSAAILFAEDPARSVSGAAVQIVRREGVGPGQGPVVERSELRGPIPDLLDSVLAFIDKHTSHREAVVGTHRERIPEYPRTVLREAVLNALAHRDYGLAGATVDISIWDDRIEIQSPGSLPGHITEDNMRAEHYSRNRRLMHVLKLFGLVEEYGEGIDRMFQEMEERLMEPPHFTATQSSVTVTLFHRSALSIDDQAWLSLLGHIDLTPQERRILVQARHSEGVTPRALRRIFGEDTDVEALLQGARAKGLLTRVGRGGGVRHVLSDEVVMRAGGGGVEARTRKRQSLLDEIRRRGSLSTAEAADFLGEDDRGFVRQMLDDLVRAGEVLARGRTRARRYHSR
jgi:ATP-dependent DNA helicase RecG